MARGSIAKAQVIKKLQEAYGDDFIGESGNKYYVWEKEDGAKIQIAISLTCPKTPIGETNAIAEFAASTPTRPAPQIEQSELDNVAELMKKLGL